MFLSMCAPKEHFNMGGENNALGKKVTFVSTFREYQMCKIQKQIVCETQ